MEKYLAGNEGERKVTKFPAKQEELDEIVFSYNERTYGITTLRERGETTRQSIVVVFRGLDRTLASYLHEAVTGEKRSFSKNATVQLVLTGEEAMQLQAAAGRQAEGRERRGIGSPSGIIEDLGRAASPYEVVVALSRPSPGTVAEALLLIHYEIKETLPGILRIRI